MSKSEPRRARSKSKNRLNRDRTRQEPSDSPAGEQSRFQGLAIVATPIGNAADITLRALATLAAADAILCEDTRVSAKLLRRHGIARPLLAYHEHNAERMRPRILARLGQGEALALISDAGRRLAASNKISVAGIPVRRASARCRSPDLAGRNPAKKNLSVGKPETVSAASAAEGPGSVVTGIPASITAWASL